MPAPGRKLGCLPEMFLEQIWKMGIPVLIEADGARRLPLKVPAGHEPVIHPRTTHVLSVYGLDAVGAALKDVCFREELAEKLLNKSASCRIGGSGAKRMSGTCGIYGCFK